MPNASLSAPTPPPWTTPRRLTLNVIGWLDRWRYRKVADGTHTHTTLRLTAEHDDGYAAVDQWAAGRRSRLEARRAELGPQNDPPRSTDTPRDPSELAELVGQDRLTWAANSRSAVEAERRFRAELAAVQRGASELRLITAELESLPELVRTAKARWSRRHEQCVAIYARARQRGVAAGLTTCALPPPALRAVQPMAPDDPR